LSAHNDKNNPSNDIADYWQLVAIGDWLVGQRFPIRQHIVMGRDASCDLSIPGTHLSRQHAELAIVAGNLEVRDLGSTNGTFVNDKKISSAVLKTGDIIRFDVLEFRIQGPKDKR
jgi:pSer/pThr/pTyr-binding forkhead associated (FHA) protein